MIVVGVHARDVERRMLLHDRVQRSLELDEHVRLQYLPAVLCAPDDMILMLVCGMV